MVQANRTKTPLFHLGCQGWAQDTWPGVFFTKRVRRDEQMAQYASVFDAVEGNTTFYALQPAEIIRKWCAEAPAHLRFCFKFPKTISHERRLVDAGAETAQFFARLAPLGERLGPFFLQLHGSFGAKAMPVLASYLRGLPREYRYAVEVRHKDFFDGTGHERILDGLLGELGMERVNFDTRGLFASQSPAARAAQGKKPRVPPRFTAIGRQPFIRFVGDPVVENNRAVLDEWAGHFARWIGEGRTPWFFAHHPDDTHAPQVARLFHELLRARMPQVPAPPAWPAEIEAAAGGRQLGLF